MILHTIIQKQYTRPNNIFLLTPTVLILHSLSHLQSNNQIIYSPTKNPVSLVCMVYHILLLFLENYFFRPNIFFSTHFHRRLSKTVLPPLTCLITPRNTKPRIDEKKYHHFFKSSQKNYRSFAYYIQPVVLNQYQSH